MSLRIYYRVLEQDVLRKPHQRAAELSAKPH